METTKTSTYSRKRQMEITRAGVIPIKVWQCYECTWEEITNEEPAHNCWTHPETENN